MPYHVINRIDVSACPDDSVVLRALQLVRPPELTTRHNNNEGSCEKGRKKSSFEGGRCEGESEMSSNRVQDIHPHKHQREVCNAKNIHDTPVA